MAKAKQLHYAWLILIAVSIIRGFAGPALNGSSGLFLKPVSDEIGVGIGQLSLYLSASSVTMLIWLPLAGNLLNRYPIKAVAIFGAFLQCTAFAALGFMSNVWGWYLMSVPLAMGAVLLVNLMGPVLINRWFASNLGLVMGLMMTITSLLGAVFQPLLTFLIDVEGWRLAYITFGGSAFVCILAVILIFLKGQPADKGLTPYRHTEKNDTQTDGTPKERLPDITARVAVRSLAFYMLVIFMVVLTGFAAFSQHITTYGLEMGYSLTTIGLALSLSMIGSAIGSILIGIFSDRLGILPTSIAVVAVGFLSITMFLGGGSVFPLFAAAAFLHGLAASSIGVVAPLLTTSFFGVKDYEKLFSLVMTGAPLASIVLLPAYGFLYDRFGNYQFVFLFLLAALIAGGICIVQGGKSSLLLRQKMEAQEKGQ